LLLFPSRDLLVLVITLTLGNKGLYRSRLTGAWIMDQLRLDATGSSSLHDLEKLPQLRVIRPHGLVTLPLLCARVFVDSGGGIFLAYSHGILYSPFVPLGHREI
jgi:hypothetical protein